jgi:glutathione-regulated potassium-efflux system ancillary protein KefG
MKKALILFAHPRYEKSRANRALLSGVELLDWITIHDLYEEYPDFNIDAAREQELLLAHQIIVWQYPFYMYSAPSMLKQWIDLVLEHGWAHGADGSRLEGKLLLNTITTGGTRESYSSNGFNRYTIAELLAPLAQTAHLCRMTWLPPFMLQGTYRLTDDMLAAQACKYRLLLHHLGSSSDLKEISRLEFSNDWINEPKRLEEP